MSQDRQRREIVFEDREDSIVDPMNISEESLRTLLCRNEDAMYRIVQTTDEMIAGMSDLSRVIVELRDAIPDLVTRANQTAEEAMLQSTLMREGMEEVVTAIRHTLGQDERPRNQEY